MRQSEQETLAARAVAADWHAAEHEEAAEQPLDVMALHERLKEVRTGRQRHSFVFCPLVPVEIDTLSRQARDKHIGKKQTHTMRRFAQAHRHVDKILGTAER